MHAFMHTHVRMHTYIHTHTHTHTALTHGFAYIKRTQTHMQMHTSRHTHAHTHTHMQNHAHPQNSSYGMTELTHRSYGHQIYFPYISIILLKVIWNFAEGIYAK